MPHRSPTPTLIKPQNEARVNSAPGRWPQPWHTRSRYEGQKDAPDAAGWQPGEGLLAGSDLAPRVALPFSDSDCSDTSSDSDGSGQHPPAYQRRTGHRGPATESGVCAPTRADLQEYQAGMWDATQGHSRSAGTWQSLSPPAGEGLPRTTSSITWETGSTWTSRTSPLSSRRRSADGGAASVNSLNVSLGVCRYATPRQSAWTLKKDTRLNHPH